MTLISLASQSLKEVFISRSVVVSSYVSSVVRSWGHYSRGHCHPVNSILVDEAQRWYSVRIQFRHNTIVILERRLKAWLRLQVLSWICLWRLCSLIAMLISRVSLLDCSLSQSPVVLMNQVVVHVCIFDEVAIHCSWSRRFSLQSRRINVCRTGSSIETAFRNKRVVLAIEVIV